MRREFIVVVEMEVWLPVGFVFDMGLFKPLWLCASRIRACLIEG